jgi:hypothetical protein
MFIQAMSAPEVGLREVRGCDATGYGVFEDQGHENTGDFNQPVPGLSN